MHTSRSSSCICQNNVLGTWIQRWLDPTLFYRSLEPAAPLKASGIPMGPGQSWVQIQALTLLCRVTEITNTHKAPPSVWCTVVADETNYENTGFWFLIICWTLRALHVWSHFFWEQSFLKKQREQIWTGHLRDSERKGEWISVGFHFNTTAILICTVIYKCYLIGKDLLSLCIHGVSAGGAHVFMILVSSFAITNMSRKMRRKEWYNWIEISFF